MAAATPARSAMGAWRRLIRAALQGEEPLLASFLRYRSDLRALLRTGGAIYVRTPANAAEGEPLVAETMIQPDGDVVIRVTPGALEDPEVWRGHQAQVRRWHDRQRAWSLAAAVVRRVALLAALGGAGLQLWP